MTFKKSELLAIIKENRDKHRAVFIEAQENYRIKVIAELDRRLTDAKEGRQIDTFIQLIAPQDQTKNYDRVIKMLEMSVEEQIPLTDVEFSQFILDRWSWTRQFAASNKSYVASTINSAYLDTIEAD
jgi:hypothetical protein